MNSELSPFVEVAPVPGLATTGAVVVPWGGPGLAGAASATPGTSEKPESALFVWHPPKSNPANMRQHRTQRRPHTCPTFVITMKPLILLKLSSRRGLVCPLLHGLQARRRRFVSSNR